MHKVVVIGAGNITSTRHIPTLRRRRDVEIVAVIDRNPEKAKALAERFQIPYFSDSLEKLAVQFSAVTIGVPPHAHFDAAKCSLELGKHVLLEKPMAMSVSEGEALTDLARTKNLILAVVQNFQFARSAEKLKSLIGEGALGTVTGFHCFQTSTQTRRLPVWHEELPLGLFYDESPHLLYLLQAFGGQVDVKDVSISPSKSGRVTPAVITAHFEANGLPATLYNNFEAPVSEWHFIVYGTKSAAVIDVFRDILVRIPNDGEHYAPDILRSSAWLVGTHILGFLSSGLRHLRGQLLYGNEEVFKRFFTAVETGCEPDGISAVHGLRVLKLQHEILRLANTLGDIAHVSANKA